MGRKGNWLLSAVKKVFRVPTRYKVECGDNFGGSNMVLAPETADIVQLTYSISSKSSSSTLLSSELTSPALALPSSTLPSTTIAIPPPPPPPPPPPAPSNPSIRDMSAIRIQAAFRGYLARREFRAVSGLLRLRRLVDGNAARSQTTQAKHCMQTMARVQTQIRSRRIRMAEENQDLQRQLLRKRHKGIEEIKNEDRWDYSFKTKEQVAANIVKRRDAAIRRERSLSYAFSNQWKSSSSRSFPVFTDFKNPQWGWSWMERWMPMNPLEQNTIDDSSSVTSTSRSLLERTTSIPSSRKERNQPATPKLSLHSRSLSLDPMAMRSKQTFPAATAKRPGSSSVSKLDVVKPPAKLDSNRPCLPALPKHSASVQVRPMTRLHGQQNNKAGTTEKTPVHSEKKSLSMSVPGRKIMQSPARSKSHLGVARAVASTAKVASARKSC